MDKLTGYLSTMKYYLAIKRNEDLTHTTTWIKNIMLSEKTKHKRSYVI